MHACVLHIYLCVCAYMCKPKDNIGYCGVVPQETPPYFWDGAWSLSDLKSFSRLGCLASEHTDMLVSDTLAVWLQTCVTPHRIYYMCSGNQTQALIFV